MDLSPFSNSSTLKYPRDIPLSEIHHVLLIDSYVPDYTIFYDSVNAQTFPILYSHRTTREEFLQVLTHPSLRIQRLAICFASSGTPTEKFLQEEDFFSVPFCPSFENVQWILHIIRQCHIPQVDFLGCNTFSYSSWREYYAYLTQETGVIIGASTDQTGNFIFGGDWVMESTGQNIELVYFTNQIEHFAYLLDTAEHTILLKSNGTVFGCGRNNFGQLGLGNTFSQSLLQPVTLNITNKYAKYVSCGANFTMIVMTDGTLYTTGQNLYGQLGLGDTSNRLQLTQVTQLGGYIPKYVACGENFTMVVMTDGSLFGAGQNNLGQLGIGLSLANEPLFVSVPLPSPQKKVQFVSCGKSHTMVLMQDHTLYGTGLNAEGQLGLGIFPPIDQTSLTRVLFVDGKTPQFISCGYLYTMVIMNDGTLYATGYNDWGQLGLGYPLAFRNFLTKVDFPVTTGVMFVSCGKNFTLALLNDGTLYATGYNGEGQLGLVDSNNRVVFTLVPTVPAGTVANMTCSLNSSFALFTHGSLYATGRNNYGQLGLGTSLTDYFEFTEVTYNVANDVSYIMDMMIPWQPTPPPPVPCFLQGTLILTRDGYKAIESLQVGEDWIETYLHGPKKLKAIAHGWLENPPSSDGERRPSRLYVLHTQDFPELTEGDLVVTGGHALLLDSAVEKVKERVQELLGFFQPPNHLDPLALDMIASLKSGRRMIDGKETFLACEDVHATFYEKEGRHCIWHIAMEGEDDHTNYGIYANGLLVEAASYDFIRHHPLLRCDSMEQKQG